MKQKILQKIRVSKRKDKEKQLEMEVCEFVEVVDILPGAASGSDTNDLFFMSSSLKVLPWT